MRLTWLFNMQLPISQSNKSRKWCWWIYGIRKEKKRMITHWRFRRSLEITFELCFSSFTGIFSSLLFLSSFYCATRSHLNSDDDFSIFLWEFYYTKEWEWERQSHAMPYMNIFVYYFMHFNFSYTLFLVSSKDGKFWREVFNVWVNIWWDFMLPSNPFQLGAGAAVSKFPPSILSFSFTYTARHSLCVV